MLLRWLHEEGSVSVGSNCILHGRVSADDHIEIARQTFFERLHAPHILFGDNNPAKPTLSTRQLLKPNDLNQAVGNTADRWLIEDNLPIPANSWVDVNLVVMGALTPGDKCVSTSKNLCDRTPARVN
jgi:hypothetical protein